MSIEICDYKLRNVVSNKVRTAMCIGSFGILKVLWKYCKRAEIMLTSYIVNIVSDANCVEIKGNVYELERICTESNKYLEEYEIDGYIYVLLFKGQRLIYYKKNFIFPDIKKINSNDDEASVAVETTINETVLNLEESKAKEEKSFKGGKEELLEEELYDTAKEKLFGKNTQSVIRISLYDILEDAILGVESLWLILAIIIWSKCNYGEYAFFSSVILIISILYDIYITYVNSPEEIEQVIEDVQIFKGGKFITKKSTEILPYDIIKIQPTNSFTCDAKITKGSLLIIESHLTGESNLMLKVRGEIVYSGSKITESNKDESEVIGLVTATGYNTRKEQLFQIVNNNDGVVNIFNTKVFDVYGFIIIFSICASIFVYFRLLKINVYSDSAFYEALDVFITFVNPSIASSISANSIKFKALCESLQISVKNRNMIKQAGFCNMAVFDKTGVLTNNVPDFYGTANLNDDLVTDVGAFDFLTSMTVNCCHTLANEEGLSGSDNNGSVVGDEIDSAMFLSMKSKIVDDGNERFIVTASGSRFKIHKMFPFDSFKASQSVLVEDENGKMFVCAKGSLLSIMPSPSKEVLALSEKFESSGYRLIAMAGKEKIIENPNKVDDGDRISLESDLEFLGFALFHDKVNEEAFVSLEELKNADLDIKVCTGDSLNTAINVTKTLKIIENAEIIKISNDFILDLVKADKKNDLCKAYSGFMYVIEGNAFSNLITLKDSIPNDLYALIMHNIVIYARCDPIDKQNVIMEYKRLGDHVLFVGDGENDIAALSEANVSLSLARGNSMMVSHFSASSFSAVLNLLRIGKTSLFSIYSVFRFCLFFVIASGSSLLLSLFFKASPSSRSFIIMDLLAFFLIPYSLSTRTALVKTNFRKDNCDFNFRKMAFILFIESVIFMHILGAGLWFFDLFPGANVSLKSKQGTLTIYANFILVIHSFLAHSKIGHVGIDIFASVFTSIPLFGLLIAFIVSLGFYFSKNEFFISFIGLLGLDKTEEYRAFGICLGIMITFSVISNIIYRRSTSLINFMNSPT